MTGRRLVCGLVLVAAAGCALAAAATGAAGADRIRGFGEIGVQGATGKRYVLRTTYLVPRSWPRLGRRRGQRLTHRFGPIGSCRIRVTISAVAVADAPEDPVARVTRLLPGTGRGLVDHGTRTNAAYRVVRASNRGVDALLVKPAPTVRQQPAPRIVWIELRAIAAIDSRTECHSGGPRTVGALLGDAFAAARVGGFEPLPN
jgi:hypothetical protein